MDIRAVIERVCILKHGASHRYAIGIQRQCGNKSRSAGSVAEHHHPANWQCHPTEGRRHQGPRRFFQIRCYYCHQVRGEDYPEPTETAPELQSNGAVAPRGVFAESIINPNAVVPKEYRNSDGTSR